MADQDSHAFGQRRPPLSVTIKAILERYPDGQIFKVDYIKTRQMQGIVGRAFARIVNMKELLANEAISYSRLVTCPRYSYCP